jgi:hypothetical protein
MSGFPFAHNVGAVKLRKSSGKAGGFLGGLLAGPRQVGKTTVVRQVMEASKIPAHYASADEPSLRDRTWLEQQWDIARLKAGENKSGALLVLDEIQKVANWASVVKSLWDADTHSGLNLKVVLLGSSPLLLQSGLTESLADDLK